MQKTANRKGQADKVIEFVKIDSEVRKSANVEYEKIYMKEVDKRKYIAREIISAMKAEGYVKFGITHHPEFWKSMDAKNPKKGFAGQLGQQWGIGLSLG